MAPVMPDGHLCRKNDAGDVEVSVTSSTSGATVRAALNVRFLRRRFVVAIALTIAAAVASQLATSGAPAVLGHARAVSSGFVSASGTQLFVDGAPWSFTGYNAYWLTSAHTGHMCGPSLSDQEMNAVFAEMAQNSGSVAVRTWFFQSYGAPSAWWQYDRVLNAAAAHGIKIIPSLVNQWGACEPGHPYLSLPWYQSGYKQATNGYPLSYRDFAITMARHYANNPTIAFWQLVNEAEAASSHGGACDAVAAAQAMRGFADDVSSAMKSVDHHHLINLGTMGGGQCGTSGSSYQYVNGGNTDICEIHDYAPKAIMGGRSSGTVPDINYCAALNKPLFAGEVGIDASVLPNWSVSGAVTSSTLAARAALFQQKMDELFRLGGVGFLIWSKSPTGQSSHFMVGTGDPTEGVLLSHQLRFNALRDRWIGRSGSTRSTSGKRTLSTNPEFAAVGVGLDGVFYSLSDLSRSVTSGWLRQRVR